ncbi:hypothetical protein E1295_05975 [Nonomuraea mesophila]|uniref:Uncharacterized protein n=1 Tax=Nonomuraea mesophila TaxID=2530382 RepID=A0A4R5FV07_9ACTN|nr:hypothetical protein [Nonomuraea mesophila]TDE58157.1 hypothetical protein E1295_05975 [Nonomuraea mesophila]
MHIKPTSRTPRPRQSHAAGVFSHHHILILNDAFILNLSVRAHLRAYMFLLITSGVSGLSLVSMIRRSSVPAGTALLGQLGVGEPVEEAFGVRDRHAGERGRRGHPEVRGLQEACQTEHALALGEGAQPRRRFVGVGRDGGAADAEGTQHPAERADLRGRRWRAIPPQRVEEPGRRYGPIRRTK